MVHEAISFQLLRGLGPAAPSHPSETSPAVAGCAANLAHALVVEERGSAVGGEIDRYSGPHHEGFGVIDANALAAHESHGERAEQRPASEGGQLRS